jgi:hypothetical protein
VNVLLLTRHYRHVATGQIHKIISHQKQEQWEGGKELIVTWKLISLIRGWESARNFSKNFR